MTDRDIVDAMVELDRMSSRIRQIREMLEARMAIGARPPTWSLDPHEAMAAVAKILSGGTGTARENGG